MFVTYIDMTEVMWPASQPLFGSETQDSEHELKVLLSTEPSNLTILHKKAKSLYTPSYHNKLTITHF